MATVTIRRRSKERVEAVAVCFLWSIANPAHELAIGRLLEAELPGVPYTLSHQVNPVVREYRRASSAAIHLFGCVPPSSAATRWPR